MGDKPKLIYVLGACGVGKSTICHRLRDKLKYTTLLDLSAVEDKTESGQRAMFKYHDNILQMFDNTKFCGMSWLCCRSFICEHVFCSLGCKEYDFEKYYRVLIKELEYLSRWYNINIFLITADEEDLEVRLQRDKFAYNPFSVKNSLMQQEQYKKEMQRLAKDTEDIKLFEIENNNIERTIDTIVKIINEGLIGYEMVIRTIIRYICI